MRKKWLAISALVLSAGAGMARADSILDNEVLFTSNASSGGTTFNYTIELTSNSLLSAGDFFEIVDFSGFTGVASTVAPNWDFSSPSFTGSVTNGGHTVSVPDSAGIPNLRWTYTGANVTNTSGLSLVLGVFSAESTLGPGPLGDGNMMAKDATVTGQLRVNSDNPTIPIPLPSAAWAGLGLLGMLGAARIRKARRA